MAPTVFFRIHFNIPNLIGTVPTTNLHYTNLLGVVSPITEKVNFCLEDVDDILQMDKDLKINSQKEIKRIINRIYQTCFFKDILHSNEWGVPATPLCPVVEYRLLRHLQCNKHPEKKWTSSKHNMSWSCREKRMSGNSIRAWTVLE